MYVNLVYVHLLVAEGMHFTCLVDMYLRKPTVQNTVIFRGKSSHRLWFLSDSGILFEIIDDYRDCKNIYLQSALYLMVAKLFDRFNFLFTYLIFFIQIATTVTSAMTTVMLTANSAVITENKECVCVFFHHIHSDFSFLEVVHHE